MRHLLSALIATTLTTVMSAAVARAADTQTPLPTITVEDTWLPEPDRQVIDLDSLPGVYADGGELLRSVPGVDGIRFGGHGIDPVIRGMSQNRINVLTDGAYLYGGCPNRMDPPTSYVSPDSYDRVTVIKGSQTVLYGAGGSAGTVLFERVTPRLKPGEIYRARIGAGYVTNGDIKDSFADVTAGGSQGFVRGIVGYKDAGNYKDGDGNAVRSAFRNSHGSVILGYTPNASTRYELELESVRTLDALYVGNMDSPESKTDNVRLRVKQSERGGLFNRIRAEVYSTKVHHLMDNFSLRAAPMMKMEAPADSQTRGARLMGDIGHVGSTQWTLGVDHQGNNRDATRYVVNGTSQAESLLWPDVDLNQSGMFAEMHRPIGHTARLKAGLRFERVDASADKAGVDPWPAMAGKLSPDALYQLYYGRVADKHSENNVGGFLRYEHDLSRHDGQWYVNISRSVRTADATERYIAANAMGGMPANPATRWVGNPGLAPEVHHQLEVGVVRTTRRWEFGGSVYYNRVGDYILRDKAAGQDGILLSDGATIYRNVDALLYGTDASLTRRWQGEGPGDWTGRLTLSYVHASNTTDHRALPQIPPLEATASLEYRRQAWMAGTRVRAAARQDRIDLASGLDLASTPGYAVMDLYARYKMGQRVDLQLGVDNVFDRTYVNHLTRQDMVDPGVFQVNEPGRSIWARATATF